MSVKVLKGFNNCFSVYVRLRQNEEGMPLQVMHLTDDTEFPIVQHHADTKEIRFRDMEQNRLYTLRYS
jgi:hypothetical protein